MEHFSYGSGCGIHVARHLKQVLAWTTAKGFDLLAICGYLNSYTTKELRNKAVSSFKNCVHCYVVLCNVFYLRYVCLCSILFITASYTIIMIVHDVIFEAPGF